MRLCYNSSVSTARTERALLQVQEYDRGEEEVMPNIKSQWKRMRKSEEQRLRNKDVRSALKTDIKKFEAAIAAGDKDDAAEKFNVASRALDKAASKGVIHKNKAANKKSRMSKSLAGIS